MNYNYFNIFKVAKFEIKIIIIIINNNTTYTKIMLP